MIKTDPDVKLNNKFTNNNYKVEPTDDDVKNMEANVDVKEGEIKELIKNTISKNKLGEENPEIEKNARQEEHSKITLKLYQRHWKK